MENEICEVFQLWTKAHGIKTPTLYEVVRFVTDIALTGYSHPEFHYAAVAQCLRQHGLLRDGKLID